MSVNVPLLLDELDIRANRHSQELWAPCPHPEHRETRPSWSIVNAPAQKNNGTHYCFGCHFTGGPVELVQEIIGVTYGYAKQWITEKGLWLKGTLPLDVKFEVTSQATKKLVIPGGLIQKGLGLWPSPIKRYAVSRGLTPEQVSRWDLRYAIDGIMSGRIVFPVKDESGKWLGWHARTYCDQDKRYKNASNADGYDPGSIFGQHYWPATKQGHAVVLTEGALDALACERVGATHIAAIGGSEPHERQMLKLVQWPTILVASDGDKAGNALYTFLRQRIGGRCSVLRVPIAEGLDAAKMNPQTLKQVLWATRNAAGLNASPAENRES